MLDKNEIDIRNNPMQIENKNKRSIEYEIRLPEIIVDRMDLFIDRFQTSYEELFNYLLRNHLYMIFSEIKGKDYELLSFYYYCIGEIFYDNESLGEGSSSKSELKPKNISVKISQELDIVIEILCEEIHCSPKLFISKAIRCQWENIRNNIDAGWYDIIDYFCNIPRIKQTLEKFFKSDNADSLHQTEINRVNKIGDKPK